MARRRAYRRQRGGRQGPRSSRMDEQQGSGTRGVARGRRARGRRGRAGTSRSTDHNYARPVPSSTESGSRPRSPSQSQSQSQQQQQQQQQQQPQSRPQPQPIPGPSSPDSLDNICPICRNQISNLCITNCNHRFCRDCLRRWTSRNATCPTCRTTIHTIRNILPDGGTEIIEISRAELLAHRVKELHSILMLLFSVMAHTLIPEVSNYLTQLNEIARELNVPTTTTRAEDAARTQSPSDATSTSASTSTTTSRPTGPGGRRRTFSEEGREDSDDEASRGTSNSGYSSNPVNSVSRAGSIVGLAISSLLGNRDSASTDVTMSPDTPPASRPVSPRQAMTGAPSTIASRISAPNIQVASSQPISGVVQPGVNQVVISRPAISNATTSGTPSTSVATPVAQTNQPRPPLPDLATVMRTVTSTAQATRVSTPPTFTVSVRPLQLVTDTNTLPTVAERRSAITTPAAASLVPLTRYNSRASQAQLSASSSSSDSGYETSYENPNIRNTYLTANQRPDPADIAPPTARPGARRNASIMRGRVLAPIMRPPTEEETRRRREQRQRDIAFLTESYNKINQVYEVLMFMHMVIHRNQVEMESPAE